MDAKKEKSNADVSANGSTQKLKGKARC